MADTSRDSMPDAPCRQLPGVRPSAPGRGTASRGRLVIASCAGGAYMAGQLVREYEEAFGSLDSEDRPVYLNEVDSTFSDGEIVARLDAHVGGADAFVVQALYDPSGCASVNDNYLSFLIAARAFKEHGAAHITGIIPYLAYARQDKPTRFKREPVSARLMSDLTAAAGVDRVITWHPHSLQVRGFYGTVPLDMLDPVAFFSEELRRFGHDQRAIVVGPDAGASRLAADVARRLGLASAAAAKYRSGAEEIESVELMGDFAGKETALIVDDIMSSGRTLDAVARRLRFDKGLRRTVLCVSHCLCAATAYRILRDLHENLGVTDVVVTNSIRQREDFAALPFFHVRSISRTLAYVVNRVHRGASVSELFAG